MGRRAGDDAAASLPSHRHVKRSELRTHLYAFFVDRQHGIGEPAARGRHELGVEPLQDQQHRPHDCTQGLRQLIKHLVSSDSAARSYETPCGLPNMLATLCELCRLLQADQGTV